MKKGKKVVKAAPLDFSLIENEESFGKVIKYKRTHLGLSIARTSSLCGISDKTLQKLENGDVGVRLSTALKVSNLLGIKLKFEV